MNPYVIGQDRNDPKAVAHLYKGTFSDPGNPMCARGWNREDGQSYSIFRNSRTGELCKICTRRAALDKPAIPPMNRKTKWL